MTTAQIPAAELREQAAQVRPGRVAVTVIGAFFAGLGWLLGTGWRTTVFLALFAWHNGLVYCALSARYGWWRGLGMTDEQIAARAKARLPSGQPPAR